MPDGAISGDATFIYASYQLIPVVDLTQPAGSRNGKMTLGALATGILGAIGAGANIDVNSGTVSVTATPSFSVVNTSTLETGDAIITGGTVTGLSLLTASTIETADAIITGGTITGLPTPSATSDAATKAYVDASVQGLQVKPTAALATAAALPSNTYSNGTSGVGATLTATASGALTVDGVAVSVGQVVLVKNEATAANNGLYTVTAAGSGSAAYVLTRHVDMQTASEFSGAFVPVGAGGTANANTLWLSNPSGTMTVGTTSVPFTELNSPYTPGTGGTGISYSGGTFTVQWNGGAVNALGANLSITSGTLNVTTSGGSLSTLTSATAANTLANGNYGQVWDWALTGTAAVGMTFGESTASSNGAGSQYLVEIATLSGSTARPFQISAQGSAVMTVGVHGELTYQPVGSSGAAGYAITLQGGTAPGGYTGGSVTIQGGTAPYTGGNVYITGGATSGGGAITTGSVFISSGTAAVGNGPTGSVTIETASGNNASSGSIFITVGTAYSAYSPGGITISAGNQAWSYGDYNGGSITFNTGNAGVSGSWGNGGDFIINLGTTAGGRGGTFQISNLQTADPSVAGAHYMMMGGVIAASAATGKSGNVVPPQVLMLAPRDHSNSPGGAGYIGTLFHVTGTIVVYSMVTPQVAVVNTGTYVGAIAPVNSGYTITSAPTLTNEFISSSTLSTPRTLTLDFANPVTLTPGDYVAIQGQLNTSLSAGGGGYYAQSWNETPMGPGIGISSLNSGTPIQVQYATPITNGSTATGTYSSDPCALGFIYSATADA